MDDNINIDDNVIRQVNTYKYLENEIQIGKIKHMKYTDESIWPA